MHELSTKNSPSTFSESRSRTLAIARKYTLARRVANPAHPSGRTRLAFQSSRHRCVRERVSARISAERADHAGGTPVAERRTLTDANRLAWADGRRWSIGGKGRTDEDTNVIAARRAVGVWPSGSSSSNRLHRGDNRARS